MMMNDLLNNLDIMVSDVACELNYNKDFELLIGVVLSAQCRDKRVNEVTKVLFDKYDSLEKLSNANIEDIKKIIKPIGMVNKKSVYVKDISKYLLDNSKGVVLNDEKFLTSIPGVGRKTSNVVRSNLFDYPAIAVDTHVTRVSKRLNIAKESDDVVVIEKKLMKYFPKEKWSRLHHQLVLFGRYKCKAIKPECYDCKLKDICIYYERTTKN